MTDYFVSAAGDDANTGRSGSPWRSLTRLNAAMADRTVRIGDRALLRRGDVFPGRLRQPDSVDPAASGWLTIGYFGDQDPPPIVDGYKTVTSWVRHAANVWKVDYSASGAGSRYTGYDSAQGGGDVGHLLVGGVVRGVRRSTVAGLAREWDFCSNGSTLYVFRATMPPAGAVRVAVDGTGVTQRSGVRLRGVAVRGHGGHGIQGPGLGGSTRTEVLDCEVYYCGGSALDGYGDGNVRYGNGIEFWVGSRDVLIDRNTVHDVYDVAITLQGGAPGQTHAFTNVAIDRNLTYRNSQGLEFWFGGDGAGYTDVVVDDNLILFSGYGWGASVRPEQESRVALLTFAWGSAGPRMRRNVYWDAAHAFRYSQERPMGMSGTESIVALRPAVRMTHQTPHTIEDAVAWVAADGVESALRAVVLPASGGTTDADVRAGLARIRALRGQTVARAMDG